MSFPCFFLRPAGPLAGLALLSMSLLPGCFAYGKRTTDVDRTPIVNTGVGATIITPRHSAPSYQPGGQGYGPPGGVVGASPAPRGGGGGATSVERSGGSGGHSGSYSDSGSGGGGGSVSFLGGSQSDEVYHQQYNEEPTWSKYVTLPFALLAAPVVAGKEAVLGPREPGPAVPRQATRTASRRPRARDYDSARLADMERELAQRAAPATAPATGGGSPPGIRALSIAEELASLQRAPEPAPAGPREARRTPLPRPLAPEGPGADRAPAPAVTPQAAAPRGPGQVDRDGDGRIDQWLYREGGRLARERRDDDFDGRAELTVHYDRATGAVRRVEEDANGDEAVDQWSDYEEGEIRGRRSDMDFDGRVDAWARYRDGELQRLEQDTDRDGRPDSVQVYGQGLLRREERDLDGDGRPELVLRYDDQERIATREEDSDGDGHIDIISHYENGRLSRREIVDPADLDRPRS